MNRKRTFDFGKVDFYGTGRKINAVEVEIEIHDFNGYDEFSICGGFWNIHKTDYVCCGQCLDEIKAFKELNKLFMELYRLWTLYHLKKVSNIPSKDRQRIYELLGVE